MFFTNPESTNPYFFSRNMLGFFYLPITDSCVRIKIDKDMPMILSIFIKETKYYDNIVTTRPGDNSGFLDSEFVKTCDEHDSSCKARKESHKNKHRRLPPF